MQQCVDYCGNTAAKMGKQEGHKFHVEPCSIRVLSNTDDESKSEPAKHKQQTLIPRHARSVVHMGMTEEQLDIKTMLE